MYSTEQAIDIHKPMYLQITFPEQGKVYERDYTFEVRSSGTGEQKDHIGAYRIVATNQHLIDFLLASNVPWTYHYYPNTENTSEVRIDTPGEYELTPGKEIEDIVERVRMWVGMIEYKLFSHLISDADRMVITKNRQGNNSR